MSVTNVEHTFSKEIPRIVAEKTLSDESVLLSDTLYLPCCGEKEFLGLLEIQGFEKSAFTHDIKNFTDMLRQSLVLALANIGYHDALEDKVRMEGELKTAAAIQHQLLPRSLPDVEILEFTVPVHFYFSRA